MTPSTVTRSTQPAPTGVRASATVRSTVSTSHERSVPSATTVRSSLAQPVRCRLSSGTGMRSAVPVRASRTTTSPGWGSTTASRSPRTVRGWSTIPCPVPVGSARTSGTPMQVRYRRPASARGRWITAISPSAPGVHAMSTARTEAAFLGLPVSGPSLGRRRASSKPMSEDSPRFAASRYGGSADSSPGSGARSTVTPPTPAVRSRVGDGVGRAASDPFGRSRTTTVATAAVAAAAPAPRRTRRRTVRRPAAAVSHAPGARSTSGTSSLASSSRSRRSVVIGCLRSRGRRAASRPAAGPVRRGSGSSRCRPSSRGPRRSRARSGPRRSGGRPSPAAAG